MKTIDLDRPEIEQPDLSELMELEVEGEGIATDGCRGIEADGYCEHGCPSWLIVMGLI